MLAAAWAAALTTSMATGTVQAAPGAGPSAASAGTPANTATSTRFEPTATVAGTPLRLNGAGTRFKAIFKVYDLGIYTAKPFDTVDELYAMPGPKRLHFVALRELSTTDLGRLFQRGMSDNASQGQVNKHVASTVKLIGVFSTKPKVAKGETFGMDYIPGKGTSFLLNGEVRGEPIGDAEFFQMILGIWFGPQPADLMLRDALLGKE